MPWYLRILAASRWRLMCRWLVRRPPPSFIKRPVTTTVDWKSSTSWGAHRVPLSSKSAKIPAVICRPAAIGRSLWAAATTFTRSCDSRFSIPARANSSRSIRGTLMRTSHHGRTNWNGWPGPTRSTSWRSTAPRWSCGKSMDAKPFTKLKNVAAMW